MATLADLATRIGQDVKALRGAVDTTKVPVVTHDGNGVYSLMNAGGGQIPVTHSTNGNYQIGA